MFFRNFYILFLLFFSNIFSNCLYAACSQAIFQNIARAAVGVQVQFLPQYPRSLAEFIQYSKTHHALDWAVFAQLNKNNLGITLNSHVDYLGRCATKVDAISNNTTSFYYPVVFPFEQAKTACFEMPKVCASDELASMINRFESRSANQIPIFHAESSNGNCQFNISIGFQEPSSIEKHQMAVMQARALARLEIARNPELAEKYQEAALEIAQLLRLMVLAENPAQRIRAQFSVDHLNLTDLFEEGYVLNNEVIPRLQNFIYKNGHANPGFSLEQRGEILQIVAPYFESLSKTLKKQPEIYSAFLNDCVSANIPGAELLLKRLKRTNSTGDAISSWFSSWVDWAPRSCGDKIAKCQFFKDFYELEQLCKTEQFAKSSAMVEAYRSRIFTAKDGDAAKLMSNEMQALFLTHDHYYHQVFNDYGIRYEHTDDPYYDIAKRWLATCPLEQKSELLSTVQETIHVRQEKLRNLFAQLKTDGKNPVVRNFAYRLIDAQSPQEIIQILAPLPADHPERDCREAYTIFMDKCLPKWISCNKSVQPVLIPKDLSLAANTQARVLYGLCATNEIKSAEQENLLVQSIGYINKSLEKKTLADKYLYLATKSYQAAATDVQQSILLCPNFNEIFQYSEQQHHAEKLLQLTVRCLQKIDDLEAGTATGNIADMQELLVDAQTIFQCIKDKKYEIAQRWMERVIAPSIEKGFLAPEVIAEKKFIGAFCSLATEEKEMPQCGAIPEINPGKVYGGQLTGDDFELKFGDSLPGLNPAQKIFGCYGEHEEVIDLDKVPQCNWGKQQQLPSFGEPAEENEQNKDGLNPELEEKENEIKKQESPEKSVEEAQGEEQKGNEKELERIKETIEEVIKQYGEEYAKKIVDESLNILPANECNFKKYKKYFEWLEQLIIDLAKIRSNMRWSKFTNDPAQNHKTTLKTVEEAIAGIACEEQNILQHLERSENEAEEFIEILDDGSFQAWDVKTFRVLTPDEQRYIFDEISYADKIKKELIGKENVIVNIIYIPESEANKLLIKIKDTFEKKDLKRIVFVDPRNADRSRQFNDSLKI